MIGRLSLRSIPDEVLDALDVLASRNERSLEAEARMALRAWVQPIIVGREQHSRLRDVSERLRLAIAEWNGSRFGQGLTASQVAEAIGESYVAHVEDWFLGRQEPSLAHLESIARLLGVRAAWLKHGVGQPFATCSESVPRDIAEALRWMRTWRGEGTEHVATLHLVRKADETGALLLLQESSSGHFASVHTNIHLSEVIGAGGEADLAHLWLTLRALYRVYTRSPRELNVVSYLARHDDYEVLTSGRAHPAGVLRSLTKALWWEDLWDSQMAKQNYWPGYPALVGRINRVLELKPHMSELIARIDAGEFMPSEPATQGRSELSGN